MKIGYLRVSTDDQNPQRQIDGLEAVCDELHVEVISATSRKRPVFNHVMRKLRRGDTLFVYDLDRGFRNTVDALTHIDKLKVRGVKFRILTFDVDCSTPFGRFVITVLAAYGQLELETLSQRTKQGMEAAKRRGKHIGRPKRNKNKEKTK